MNTHYFNAENLCQLLIHSREQAHKTQRYMAKALRRCIQTIQNWEYGIPKNENLHFVYLVTPVLHGHHSLMNLRRSIVALCAPE